MSVAFAAPRQRGKGEITPAAIQKVKARGAGRQVQPALGRHAGPARAAGAGAGLRGTVAEAPRSAAAPEWAATLSARRVPRAGALPCGHKARVPAAGSPREGAVRARRAGKAVGPAAPSPGPRVVPKLLWRGLAQRALPGAEPTSGCGRPPSGARQTQGVGAPLGEPGGRCRGPKYRLRVGRGGSPSDSPAPL